MLMHARAGVEGWEAILPISDGLSYSLPLMLILLSHELGHYLVARLHGVDASLPYFIPLPPTFGLGTMGAVIGMRDVTSDRKKLIDIGAAGPLAGLLVAIPVILYGLTARRSARWSPGGRAGGNSLLYALLKHAGDRGLAPRRQARRLPAPDGLGRLGRPPGHDDQPDPHRAARRRAHRDRLLRQRLRPIRDAAAPDACRSARWPSSCGSCTSPRSRPGAHWNESMGRTIALRRRAPLADLVHDDPDPAGGVGRREPSARRRHAAAAQPQAALLADGGGVRRRASCRCRSAPASRAATPRSPRADRRRPYDRLVDARSQP